MKNGLITAFVALIALGGESVYLTGSFDVSAMLRVLARSVSIGFLVGLAVYFMDKKD